MPNIKSSERRVRSNERKAEYNKRVRSELKTVVKKAISAQEQDLVNKDDIVKVAQKKLTTPLAKVLFTRILPLVARLELLKLSLWWNKSICQSSELTRKTLPCSAIDLKRVFFALFLTFTNML